MSHGGGVMVWCNVVGGTMGSKFKVGVVVGDSVTRGCWKARQRMTQDKVEGWLTLLVTWGRRHKIFKNSCSRIPIHS